MVFKIVNQAVIMMTITTSLKPEALVLLILELVLFIQHDALCDPTVVVDPLVPLRRVRFQPTQQRGVAAVIIVVIFAFAGGDCGKTFTNVSQGTVVGDAVVVGTAVGP